MKVTFPHMGNLALTAKTVLEGLGLEVIVPPPCTQRTLSLGVRHAPEFACLPLKINLGNYLEAAELGADTVVMAGGIGPCRIGYYAQVQQEILRDLGLNLEMVVLEPPDAHFSEVWDKVNYLKKRNWKSVIKGVQLAWEKSKAIDLIEKKLHQMRPREKLKGSADNLYRQAYLQLDQAGTKKELLQIITSIDAKFQDIPVMSEETNIIRIALVGEIYTVLEPFINLNLERHLGQMGVEVVRSLYLSGWINDHLLGGFLNIQGTKNAKKLAAPFLNSFVGGHGRETIGSTVEFARQGIDGVIQVAPLTCMPEIVAHSILPTVSKHFNLPTMTIYLDEQSGEAGLVTRLEAFVDMIRRRKSSALEGV